MVEYTKSLRRNPGKFRLTNDRKCDMIPFVKFYRFTFLWKGAWNMKSQAYRMALLFDFYGDVLTDRQKEFYDLYYNEDLSLAEIAENYGITRQGVRDVIVRAEAILTDLEDKTGLIKRFHAMQKQFQEMEAAAQQILTLSARYDDPELESQARKILELVQQMEKE